VGGVEDKRNKRKNGRNAMDSVGSTGKRMEWIGNKRAQSGTLLISAASSLNYMLFVSCIVRPRKRIVK
jgi:hypothetical protein